MTKKVIVNDRWHEDTMIVVSRKTRADLKLQALLEGKTIKQLVSILISERKNEARKK